MSFQITLLTRTQTASNRLGRQTVLTFDDAAITLGPQTSACPLDGWLGPEATIRQAGESLYNLVVPADGVLRLNDAPCSAGTHPLHSGDRLGWGDAHALQFHVCFPKVGQSWRSSLLSHISRAAIVVVFIAVLLMMFWLPKALSSSAVYAERSALMHLSQTIDRLRNHARDISKLKNEIPTLNLLLNVALLQELDNRARYLRENEEKLTVEQFQQHADYLVRVDAWLQKLERKDLFAPLPKPDTDSAVKKMLLDNQTRLESAKQ